MEGLLLFWASFAFPWASPFRPFSPHKAFIMIDDMSVHCTQRFMFAPLENCQPVGYTCFENCHIPMATMTSWPAISNLHPRSSTRSMGGMIVRRSESIYSHLVFGLHP